VSAEPNAPPAPAAPPPAAEQPPSPPPEAPAAPAETPAPETPEAVAPPEPDHAGWLATQDEQTLSELPAVKDLIERREQSVRDATRDEAERASRRAEQQWFQRGGYKTDLQALATVSDDGQVVFDAEGVDALSGRQFAAMQDLAREELSTVVSSRLGDASVPAARVDQLVGLADRVHNGQAQPEEFLHAQLDLLRDVEVEQRLAEREKELRAELEAENAQSAEVQQRRDAEAARAATTTPTHAIQGQSGTVYGSKAAVEAAHVRGEITDAEMAGLTRDGRFSSLPDR
jgi:hypothetical protein